MKRTICTGIIAASVVAAYVTWQSGKWVYNIVGGERIYLHMWAIGPEFCKLGFSEYYHSIGVLPHTQDEKYGSFRGGIRLPSASHHLVYTEVYLWNYRDQAHYLTLRAHSWVVVFAASILLGGFIGMALDALNLNGK
jgi:hypothetical protein